MDKQDPEQLVVTKAGDFPFILPAPAAGDVLEVIEGKVRGLAQVVASGGRLALPSNQTSTLRKHDAETFAKERMASVEREQYEQWKQNPAAVPPLDWATNTVPIPPNSLKTFSQRAMAMDLVWHHQGATPEHAAWLTSHMTGLLPLVKAITKVLGAQTHLETHDPLARLSAAERAEVETLQLVTAAVERNVALERERVRKLIESINEDQAVFKTRLQTLAKHPVGLESNT
ncbi:hypothetical protein NUU61_000910 [Penicillium alfredii]|uniref:Uncharacterized protein n=1 Tax=Penicillium alfredii TaxID=1506179 RepID=A0A9W9GAG6_9EURO|nr:uncharacterized protein NUU61_000910 [Penicillium alfredii]KAJ5115151.1 hypothetical protein NUU61_000910 [Penicillium alfredii]